MIKLYSSYINNKLLYDIRTAKDFGNAIKEVLKSNFKRAEDSGTIIIGLKNILSEQEMEEKVLAQKKNKK